MLVSRTVATRYERAKPYSRVSPICIKEYSDLLRMNFITIICHKSGRLVLNGGTEHRLLVQPHHRSGRQTKYEHNERLNSKTHTSFQQLIVDLLHKIATQPIQFHPNNAERAVKLLFQTASLPQKYSFVLNLFCSGSRRKPSSKPYWRREPYTTSSTVNHQNVKRLKTSGKIPDILIKRGLPCTMYLYFDRPSNFRNKKSFVKSVRKITVFNDKLLFNGTILQLFTYPEIWMPKAVSEKSLQRFLTKSLN